MILVLIFLFLDFVLYFFVGGTHAKRVHSVELLEGWKWLASKRWAHPPLEILLWLVSHLFARPWWAILPPGVWFADVLLRPIF